MNYTIRQKIVSFSDTFNVTDVSGAEIMKIQRKLIVFVFKKFDVFDAIGKLIYKIVQRYRFTGSRFEVIDADSKQTVAEITVLMSFNPKCEIKIADAKYNVTGNFVGWSFCVSDDVTGEPIAFVTKDLAFTDKYQVDVKRDDLSPLLLPCLTMLDVAFHS